MTPGSGAIAPTRTGQGQRQQTALPPHDIDAEEALLGAMMRSREAIEAATRHQVESGDFYRPAHGHIFEAITGLYDGSQGDSIDPVRVSDALRRVGLLDVVGGKAKILQIQSATPASANAGHYARIVRDCAGRRRLIHALTQSIEGARDLAVLDPFGGATEAITSIAPTPSLDALDIEGARLDGFLDRDDREYDWLIEGLLERGDRLILTGPEGGGKSTLLRTLAVKAAAGVHPFTDEAIDPLTVLLVDLENSEAHVRRKLRVLRTAAAQRNLPLLVVTRPEGLDLLDTEDFAWLRSWGEAAQPDLILLGPLYKLHAGDPNEEMPAKAVASALDALRTSLGTAIAIEAHTPHEPKAKRPYGASLWKRWPEFGLHLSREGTLTHWRGERDERQWPRALTRGGVWPWVAVERDRDVLWARIVDHVRERGAVPSERDLAAALDSSKSTVHRVLVEERASEWAALQEEVGA